MNNKYKLTVWNGDIPETPKERPPEEVMFWIQTRADGVVELISSRGGIGGHVQKEVSFYPDGKKVHMISDSFEAVGFIKQ